MLSNVLVTTSTVFKFYYYLMLPNKKNQDLKRINLLKLCSPTIGKKKGGDLQKLMYFQELFQRFLRDKEIIKFKPERVIWGC